ncbi:MAG: hypothetical protein OEZ57_07460 [Nitrospirota bacterium]|nr:hypothetical protein [Nitrospirota bacterium]
MKFIEFIEDHEITFTHIPVLSIMRPASNLLKIIFRAGLLIICPLISACHQAPKQYPQGHPSTKTQPPQVEQQLLATIQDAESLGPGNPLLLSSLYSLADYYHGRKEYEKSADQTSALYTLKNPSMVQTIPILRLSFNDMPRSFRKRTAKLKPRTS